MPGGVGDDFVTSDNGRDILFGSYGLDHTFEHPDQLTLTNDHWTSADSDNEYQALDRFFADEIGDPLKLQSAVQRSLRFVSR